MTSGKMRGVGDQRIDGNEADVHATMTWNFNQRK